MPVCRVDDQHVDVRADQRLCARKRVRPDPDRGADAEPAPLVLRRVGILDLLLDVLDGDEPAQPALGVDDRKLLDLVAVEDLLGLRQRRADRSGDEVARSHEGGDGLRRVVLEAQVAVGEDADEDLAVVGDRHAADVEMRHQREGVRDEGVRAERHGLDDHSGLAPLDLVDLGDLRVDRQVALDDADASRAGERDREARLGHGVHRRRHDRYREPDRPRELRCRRDVVREDARLGRNEEDVVEREPFLGELLLERKESLELCSGQFDGHDRSYHRPPTAYCALTGSTARTTTVAARRATSRESNRPPPSSSVAAAPVATAPRSDCSCDCSATRAAR